MSALVNFQTRLICQGITGAYGGRHASACRLWYKLVAGVTPERAAA